MIAASRFRRTDAVLRGASGKRFSAAVARVECGGELRFERAYGVTRLDEHAQPVYPDTAFDLASLTKVFISSLVLRAARELGAELDGPLLPWFPEWRDLPHRAITLRMLLAHTSGMNSGADYRELLGRDVVEFAVRRDLAAPPGERVIYSDLGFIALGEWLQRARGAGLQSLPASVSAAAFRPRAHVRRSIPATEDDGWRGRVQGYVHDEKAYLMNGIAGHAGLFGTALDVARLAEAYLGPLHGRPSSLQLADAREAIAEQAYDPVLRRGLGWALRTTEENSCGKRFGPHTFGHTGFVGTCMWADPDRDCSVALLTNAVYFGRNDIRELRAAFCDAVVEDLTE